MFSVGRYDPNLDNGEQKVKVNSKSNSSSSQSLPPSSSSSSSSAKLSRSNKKRKIIEEGHYQQSSRGDNLRRSQRVESENDGGLKEVVESDVDVDDDNDVDIDVDDNGDNSSSSCPSSSSDEDDGDDDDGDGSRAAGSSSSSSAPSFDDDSDGDHDGDANIDEESPALQVIAPEQKENSIDVMRKKLKTTSEGIDDFDHDGHTHTHAHSQFTGQQQSNEVKKALRMSKLAIKDAAKVWDLAPFLVKNLERDQYKSFFPIQALVIPDVIASERHAHIRNRDVCVSSPTGSGKTLAFVIPVLNSLARRKIRRLRALVVLPSRDLATQVYEVFERYAQGSDLRIKLAIGQNDFEAEQRNLTIGCDYSSSKNYHRIQHALQPFSISNTLQAFGGDNNMTEISGCTWSQTNLKRIAGLSTSYGGISSVDVMVCTPGRLIDHLDKTPGFTLQHLRFLVIDEADRLVNQSYQNWIQRVIDAASAGPENIRAGLLDGESVTDTSLLLSTFDPVTWRKEVGSIDEKATTSFDLNRCLDSSVCRHVQLRKFLFSATLTKDPKKLASLGLVNPKHFDAHQLNNLNKEATDTLSYSLPEGLAEFMLECTAEQKPLVLLAVLLEQGLLDKDRDVVDGIAVVFTSSKDSTHRLARLLQLLWGAAGYGSTSSVAEFSGALNQKQRAEIMKRCNGHGEGPRIQVIVCSDGMSRGMDIQSVSAVVNYDVPGFAKTYVHRCGRTARAGKKGRAITILKGGQVTKFLKMRQLIGSPEKVTKMGIKKELVKAAIPVYQKCIKALQNVMDAETDNEISLADPLGPEWLT